MKKILLIMVSLTMFSFVGCDSSNTTRIKFVNRSAHRINIRPDGDLFWDDFSLDPGERGSVKAERVFFRYSPEHLVEFTEDGDTIIFVTIGVSEATSS